MSRNFELMTRIEREFGTTQDTTRPATGSAAVRAVRPADVAGLGGEEMLRLVQNIFLSANGRAPRQVVFCGVDQENGSSSVCAGVGKALAAARAGSVCLVDANSRGSRLAALWGVDVTAAFPRKSASVRERCLSIGDDLWLAGDNFLTDDRGSLPSAVILKQLLEELRDAFDFVLIDAPGAGISGDAATLGQMVDGTVLVIEADTTRRLAARKAKDALDVANVRLLGTVLHNRSFPIPEGLYRRL